MSDQKEKTGSSSGNGMKKLAGFLVVIGIIISVVLVISMNGGNEESASPARKQSVSDDIPKLIDLGADKCIPCKKMAPILETLKEEFKGRFNVVFIDVWKDRSQARRYGIRLIPTQIYFDDSGKELHRHQGFASREDILNTWKELGYKFKEK